MFADFLKIIQELVLGFLDALLRVSDWSDSSMPMKLLRFLRPRRRCCRTPEGVQEQCHQGDRCQKALQQFHGLLGLMKRCLAHYGDVIDSRMALVPLAAFQSIGRSPLEHQTTNCSRSEAPRLVSADTFVPHDDAPPHPAGICTASSRREFLSPRTSPGSAPPSSLPQLAAYPSHEGREARWSMLSPEKAGAWRPH